MFKENELLRLLGCFFFFIALMFHPASGFGAEKFVSYLSLADYTGPIAGLNVVADLGAQDYCKYINDHGGVKGVKIRFIGVDTRYDVARMISAYKRHKRGERVYLMNSISSGGAKALSPLIKKDKIVQYAPHDGEMVAHPGWSFTWGPTYPDMFCAMMDWILKDWKAKGNSGAPIVGYMGWDNPYGKEPLKGGREYAEKLGIKLLKPEFFPPATLDSSIYLNRLANADATYIIVGGIDPNPTNVLRDAHKLGLTKSIQFVTDWWGPSEQVGIKSRPLATEGTVVIAFFVQGEDARKNPMAKLWQKYQKKPLAEMPGQYLMGMTWIMNYAKALEMVLANVEYEKLNGDLIYQAFQNLTGLEREGIIGPCTYSKTSRRSSRDVRFYRVKNGKTVPISGWITAPDGVSMYNEW